MFYGRVILVLSTINVAVEGAVKQLFPVLLVVFVSTFGWSNAATAAVFGVGGLAGGLAGGRLVFRAAKPNPHQRDDDERLSHWGGFSAGTPAAQVDVIDQGQS